LGQYLQPTIKHLPVLEYVHPDEFERLKGLGESMGFKAVFSGPFVRSSYLAEDLFESAKQLRRVTA
jgi:lipoic acid synthetase